MSASDRIKARIAELEEERRQIVDGEESYGDSDEEEVGILDARIEELTQAAAWLADEEGGVIPG